MHSEWSDESASVKEMADVGEERGYEYIAITDHAQGLKIAGGTDEKQLSEQGVEISAVNDAMKRTGKRIRVLRSIELNLSPRGEGDLEPRALGKLDVVLGVFIFRCAKKRIRRRGIWRRCATLRSTFWGTREGAFTIFGWGLLRNGRGFLI
jgi:histidinol phosphatase-like PHP family hydrolase